MSSKRSTVRFERRGPNQILLLILRKYKECPVLQLEELMVLLRVKPML